VITDSSVTPLQLSAQVSGHEPNLHRLTVTRRNTQEQKHLPNPAKEIYRRRTQHIHTEFVDSQHTLCQQQQVLSADEQTSHADHLSAEAKHNALKSLISTLDASDKKRRAQEETVATAKARSAGAEATTSKFHSDVKAAIDRGRKLHERLNNLTKFTSRKGRNIRSIAEKSPMVQTKPEGTKDGIARLGAELPVRRKHDHRLGERKDLFDEPVRMQDSREAEAHLVAPSAQDNRGNPDLLRQSQSSRIRARRQTSLDGVHPPRSRLPANEPVDTGQPPLPPEEIDDTGTSPLCPAVEPGSSVCPTKSSLDPSHHDWGGPSSRYTEDLLLVSAPFDPECEIAKSSSVGLQELIELMRHPGSEDAQDVKQAKPDDRRLQEERALTTERLRLIEQDALTLRRDLDRSREQARKAENHARDLETDFHAKLREADDMRRVSESKFVQVVEQLRIRRAELESSRSELEASQFKCSQVTFLSAAQQERIHELEAKVKALKNTQNHSATTVSRTVSSSFFPTHAGMGVP
jgi:hypothetical protein